MTDEAADQLAQLATTLYAELPGGFIAARDARAKQLRADGDKDLAAQVKALRRPTVAAWLVNLLAHEEGTLDPLATLGEQLREAQSHLDIDSLKRLAAQRPATVEGLADDAVRLATAADPSFAPTAATREQVIATLTAALADPLAEQATLSGRLVSPLAYAGFGEVEIGDAIATPLRAVPDRPEPAESPAREEQPKADAPSTDSPAAQQDSRPTAADLKRAEAAVAKAEAALEVAEAGLAQARSRRAAARRALETATATLEDLQDQT